MEHFLNISAADGERDPTLYPETRRTSTSGRRLDIDHIFVKGHRNITKRIVWGDAEVDWDETVSDHMPLVTEIEF